MVKPQGVLLGHIGAKAVVNSTELASSLVARAGVQRGRRERRKAQRRAPGCGARGTRSPSSTASRSRRGTITLGLERRPDLRRKQHGLFPGGEVTALVHLVEIDDVGLRLLDPAWRGPPDLSGERREPDRNRNRRERLAWRTSFSCLLPSTSAQRTPPAASRCPASSSQTLRSTSCARWASRKPGTC